MLYLYFRFTGKVSQKYIGKPVLLLYMLDEIYRYLNKNALTLKKCSAKIVHKILSM